MKSANVSDEEEKGSGSQAKTMWKPEEIDHSTDDDQIKNIEAEIIASKAKKGVSKKESKVKSKKTGLY